MKYLFLILILLSCRVQALEHPSTKVEWQASMPRISRTLVSQLVRETKELSKKLPKSMKQKPYLFLMRGNSGAGKSQAIASLPYNIKQGTINPDIAKYRLREKVKRELGVDLSYQEADIEGEKIFNQWIEEFIRVHRKSSFMIDRRMLRVTDIEKKLSIAQAADADVYIIDIEAPLEVSCIRCLIRPKGEKNPHVDYDCIEEGYRKIHQERAELIRHIKHPSENSPFHRVTHYELRYNDGLIECLVASKNPHQGWVVHHPQLFDQIVDQPLGKIDEIIHAIRKATIDDAFIEKALRLSFVQTLKKEGRSELAKPEVVEDIIKGLLQTMKENRDWNVKTGWERVMRGRISPLHDEELEGRVQQLAIEFAELLKFKGQPLSTLLVAQ